MSTDTKIEWADKTWSPTIGCDRVSPGCDRCYAITTARIREHNPHPKIAAAFAGTTERTASGIDWTGKVNLLHDRLGDPLRWKKPIKVFVNSTSDLFHGAIPDEYIAQVFAVMALTPQHTFQVLTKRHGRMRSLLSNPDFEKQVDRALLTMPEASDSKLTGRSWTLPKPGWPLPNVWLGVSVEDQKRADLRIPALLDTPAAIRFLSCEPLLGPVDLSAWMPPGFANWRCQGPDCLRFYTGPLQRHCPDCGREGHWTGSHTGNGRPNGQPIGWVIAGGESGPGARPMHPNWARSLRDQCVKAEIPFFFKQHGEYLAAPVTDDPAFAGGRAYNHPLHGGRSSATLREPGPSRTFRSGATRLMRPGDRTARTWLLDADTIAVRVGRAAAGRELDGRTWDEFPRTES